MSSSRNTRFLFIGTTLVVGAVIVFIIGRQIEQNASAERELQRSQALERSINQLQFAVDNFATLVSGIRSYIELSPEFPSASVLQQYVNSQLRELNYTEEIAVSFLDPNHKFIYSFTREEIDPVGLTGQTLLELRGAEEVIKLDSLLLTDSLRLYPPLNVREGWLGIPIDFRVEREGEVIGYIASLLNARVALDRLYNTSDQFVYRFSTPEGIVFDRVSIYDGSEAFNIDTDPEFYKNFDLEDEAFVYDVVNLYGFSITVGVAYKESAPARPWSVLLLYSWYLILVVFVIILTTQAHRLDAQKQRIDYQNKLLLKAADTRNKFFGIISHDLRAPLNSLFGLVSLFKNEKIENPKLMNLVTKLEDSTKRTRALLENLLKWASLQTDQIAASRATIKVLAFVGEIVELYKPQTEAKGQHIDIQIDSEVGVYADKDMFDAIFRNLLNNAIKFTAKGVITVSHSSDEGFDTFSICDSGVGMDERTRSGLFAVDQTFSRKGTAGELGTGLGLILCKEYVELHGGKIWAESEEREGSCIYFTISRK